jgi:hypothetical protein
MNEKCSIEQWHGVYHMHQGYSSEGALADGSSGPAADGFGSHDHCICRVEFVVSHPFHKEREMDGFPIGFSARTAAPRRWSIHGARLAQGHGALLRHS